MSLAGSTLPSLNVAVMCSASSITWLLVTMRPDGSMMKPVPSEVTCRGCARSGPRKFLNSWESGEGIRRRPRDSGRGHDQKHQEQQASAHARQPFHHSGIVDQIGPEYEAN